MIDIREILWEGENWIHLDQVKDQWYIRVLLLFR
jgi:hypothetical protein